MGGTSEGFAPYFLKTDRRTWTRHLAPLSRTGLLHEQLAWDRLFQILFMFCYAVELRIYLFVELVREVKLVKPWRGNRTSQIDCPNV